MSLPRAKREHVPRSARAGLGVPISLFLPRAIIVRNQWRSNLAKEVEGTPACGLCAQRGFSPLSAEATGRDRKSTRLNSSHVSSSYAVFCLKKKKTEATHRHMKAET